MVHVPIIVGYRPTDPSPRQDPCFDAPAGTTPPEDADGRTPAGAEPSGHFFGNVSIAAEIGVVKNPSAENGHEGTMFDSYVLSYGFTDVQVQ